jgi:nucleoside-diphosphate-sugar epimerase
MKKPSLLIVGCGDLGHRVGKLLSPQGWHLSGVRRRPPETPDPDGGIDYWYSADYAQQDSLNFAESLRPDFVLASFTPVSMDTAGYRRGFSAAASHLIQGLGKHRPVLLIMVSSTRVYAESQGGWVDESSPLTTTDERGLEIVDAERQFLASAHNASVVRCGGIYGMAGGRLLSKIAQGRVAPEQPTRYTNRIHRDDCAGFLVHLLQRAQRSDPVEPIYNAVDNAPATAHQVESYIAAQLGIVVNQGEVVENTRPVNHKRCSNELLQQSGFSLRYPDYRAGYSELCKDAMAESLSTLQ